jgi:NADH-ubiquinone oxidoreductase chain 2
MIFISILVFIVASSGVLPSIKKELSSIFIVRITSIVFIYSAALSLNVLDIQSIGSGIGIYNGLFHVTLVSSYIDTFLLIIGALILIPRPINLYISKILPNLTTYRNNNITNNTSNTIDIKNYNINNDNYELLPSVNLSGQYSLIILFSTLGSLMLLSSSDLISMYLSIELQSFGLYILSTLFRDSKLATSAGLKYFLLGALSSCFILLGSALVYSYTGLTNLDSIYSIISISDSSNNISSINQGINIGIILIILGFMFKIAAAPLHNWAPDVYDDSPTIVTIWLTIMPKIAILFFLLYIVVNGIGIITYNHSNIFNLYESILNTISNSNNESISIISNKYLNLGTLLTNLLLISSLLSLIIGTVVGLAQSRIKRLLAYSTISHIGFILLALAVNTEQSIESFIFYIIQYSITNLNTFLIILAFGYLIYYSNNNNNKNIILDSYSEIVPGKGEKDIRYITELKGQFISNPLLSLSLSICLFSMAGIPPLIGFFSKQMVLYSAIQSGYYFISIIAIITSVISASYYLKIVRVLYTENTQSDLSNITTNDQLLNNKNNHLLNGKVMDNILSNYHSLLISFLTLSLLLFILKPSILLNSSQLLSLSYFNF